MDYLAVGNNDLTPNSHKSIKGVHDLGCDYSIFNIKVCTILVTAKTFSLR